MNIQELIKLFDYLNDNQKLNLLETLKELSKEDSHKLFFKKNSPPIVSRILNSMINAYNQANYALLEEIDKIIVQNMMLKPEENEILFYQNNVEVFRALIKVFNTENTKNIDEITSILKSKNEECILLLLEIYLLTEGNLICVDSAYKFLTEELKDIVKIAQKEGYNDLVNTIFKLNYPSYKKYIEFGLIDNKIDPEILNFILHERQLEVAGEMIDILKVRNDLPYTFFERFSSNYSDGLANIVINNPTYSVDLLEYLVKPVVKEDLFFSLAKKNNLKYDKKYINTIFSKRTRGYLGKTELRSFLYFHIKCPSFKPEHYDFFSFKTFDKAIEIYNKHIKRMIKSKKSKGEIRELFFYSKSFEALTLLEEIIFLSKKDYDITLLKKITREGYSDLTKERLLKIYNLRKDLPTIFYESSKFFYNDKLLKLILDNPNISWEDIDFLSNYSLEAQQKVYLMFSSDATQKEKIMNIYKSSMYSLSEWVYEWILENRYMSLETVETLIKSFYFYNGDVFNKFQEIFMLNIKLQEKSILFLTKFAKNRNNANTFDTLLEVLKKYNDVEIDYDILDVIFSINDIEVISEVLRVYDLRFSEHSVEFYKNIRVYAEKKDLKEMVDLIEENNELPLIVFESILCCSSNIEKLKAFIIFMKAFEGEINYDVIKSLSKMCEENKIFSEKKPKAPNPIFDIYNLRKNISPIVIENISLLGYDKIVKYRDLLLEYTDMDEKTLLLMTSIGENSNLKNQLLNFHEDIDLEIMKDFFKRLGAKSLETFLEIYFMRPDLSLDFYEYLYTDINFRFGFFMKCPNCSEATYLYLFKNKELLKYIYKLICDLEKMDYCNYEEENCVEEFYKKCETYDRDNLLVILSSVIDSKYHSVLLKARK